MIFDVFFRFPLDPNQFLIFSHNHKRQIINIIGIVIPKRKATLTRTSHINIQQSFLIKQLIIIHRIILYSTIFLNIRLIDSSYLLGMIGSNVMFGNDVPHHTIAIISKAAIPVDTDPLRNSYSDQQHQTTIEDVFG